MIIRECKNLESTIHFYDPFEYTDDIVFSFSEFQDLDLIHCYVACPRNKIFFNLRLYCNIQILRAMVLGRLSEEQKRIALNDIRKATGIKSIKDFHYGGNGLFQSTFISRSSLKNVIDYLENQERIFGDMSVMSWDGFNGWGSDVIISTPFKEEIKKSNGNHLPVIQRLIKSIKDNKFGEIITKDDYNCLSQVLINGRLMPQQVGELELRSIELIDELNLPMFYDEINIISHPKDEFFRTYTGENRPFREEFLRHARHYTESMETAYPFLKWNLETSAPHKEFFGDIFIASMKVEIPNWSGGKKYDDYGHLIAPTHHSTGVSNTGDQV